MCAAYLAMLIQSSSVKNTMEEECFVILGQLSGFMAIAGASYAVV